MGCGTSKSVQTVDDTNANSNGNVVKADTNGMSNGTTAGRRQSRPMTPVPKPVAFDIPLDSEEGEDLEDGLADSNVVKKLPPKRLLTLAEQPAPQLTAKQLSDKQLRAEEKRLEVLEEKRLKAQKFFHNFNNNSNNSNNVTNTDNTNSNQIESQNHNRGTSHNLVGESTDQLFNQKYKEAMADQQILTIEQTFYQRYSQVMAELMIYHSHKISTTGPTVDNKSKAMADQQIAVIDETSTALTNTESQIGGTFDTFEFDSNQTD